MSRIRQLEQEKMSAKTKALEEAKADLEIEVAERTKELQDKLLKLERFNKVAVGRELKMVQLKEEIARLKGEAGEQ